MAESTESEKKEALRRRTKLFASSVVQLFIKLERGGEAQRVLGKQLLRSGTSVAANFREASRARSADEFVAKIEICVQEADESQLWLKLLTDDCGVLPSITHPIHAEANELISIFVTMAKRTKENRSR